MRGESLFALGVLLGATSFAPGQQPAPAPSLPNSRAVPALQTPYYAGAGVTAPEPLSPIRLATLPRHCGTVVLQAVVHGDGTAGEIGVVQYDDAALAQQVTELLAKSTFKPGTYNGVPAAIAITAIFTCSHHLMSADQEFNTLLREQPQGYSAPSSGYGSQAAHANSPGPYQIGGDITPPILLHATAAKFSNYARKKKITGTCIVGLTVDANGLPQDIHMVKSLEPSLDQSAIDAVKQYRFKPAMKDGTTPVPVKISVEVDFHLY